MKNYLLKLFTALGILFLSMPFAIAQEPSPASSSQPICVSSQELALYKALMQYRKEKKLPSIPLSPNLTKVAQMHAEDVANHFPFAEGCNLHTWSESTAWSGCCYTADHAQAKCMWDKPRELSNYTGSGFEISSIYLWNNDVKAKDIPTENAMNGWKKSKGHNDIITNQGAWKDKSFKAIGVGTYKGYACVWFGMEPDNEARPVVCPQP